MSHQVYVRRTTPDDFAAIEAMSRLIYDDQLAWTRDELASHQRLFPEGQFVAVARDTGEVVGTAMSLIVAWEDYDIGDDYIDFTADSTFRNHDRSGRTLYGAEVFVHPHRRGMGIGGALYEARRQLCRELGLLRIRAGARLPGYHKAADRLSVYEYVREVIAGRAYDPTLSFQLRQGFSVIAIVSGYLAPDAASRNYAAVIEWLNTQEATDAEIERARSRYLDSIS
ncbi:MAG: GNAT family N-acetyltransferase [Spirochaetota bacterium]